MSFMRILYLIREDFEEIVSPAYYELVQEFKRQGHQVTVANLSGKFLNFPCIKIKQFKFIDYPFGFINRFLFGKAVSKAVKPENFDIVLSSMAETLFFLARWDIPKTAIIHDNFAERAKFTPLIAKQFKSAVLVDSFFQKHSMKKADGLIFLNAEEKLLFEKTAFSEKAGENFDQPFDKRLKQVAKTKCIVIHNGIFMESFPAEKKETEKLKEKFPGKIVLFLARIELQKNPLLFLKAAEKLREKAFFLIAGKGPLGAEVKKFIKEKNLSDKVKFLGWVNQKEKVALLNSCSVYVLPSLFEPVSISTLEAMTCKKPVIVSDVGGLKELVDSSVGIKIQPDNLEELVKALDFLLKNEKKAQELGINAFNKVKREFLWNTIAEKYIKFFGGLINEKK